MEINLNRGEVCLLIALCKACGGLTNEKSDFDKITQKLNESIGLGD